MNELTSKLLPVRIKDLKPNFWIIQIIGWCGFTIIEIFSNQEWFNYSYWIFYILSSSLIGFCLTIILRKVYRYFFIKLNIIYLFIPVSMVFSLLFGGIWYISRQFCYIVIDAIKVGFANIDLKFIIDAVFYNHDSNIAKGVFFSTWPFLVWSIFYFSIKFLFTIVQEREKSTNAILLANKAQLQMLRYQINPHFLFNSLNSIKALTTENPELAGFMLTELAEFLRSTLNYNDRIYISVAEEIDIIGKYLSIEKIRFEERLDFKITYDEHIQKQEMPCFITQPLVENAIMHGLSKNPIGIMLNIDFKINDGFLVITIENTGVKGIKEFNNGTGIKNIIERLENMYPGKFRFDLTESNNIVKAQLQIPVTS